MLEHVGDLDKVIAETARVLRFGGVYLYDTINRTLPSKLIMIKLFQEWSSTAFMPPNLHDWDMFIKPKELLNLLSRYGLENREVTGLKPTANPVRILRTPRRRKRGEINHLQAVEAMNLRQSRDKSVLYIGYAVKTREHPA